MAKLARSDLSLGYVPAPREFICKFCGEPSAVDPADQIPPPDYCQPGDHA